MTGDRMEPDPGEGNPIAGLTKGRMEALTDGIFAFAMTLLVTTMDFPNAEAAPLAPLTPHMLAVTYFPDLMNYFLAFAILAMFWVTHHTLFHHIHSIDRTILWLNILSLFFVALLPFTTDLVGDYSEPLAAILFEANLLAIGLLLFLIWNYATTDGRFVERTLSGREVRTHGRRTLLVPVVSLAGIFLALLGFGWTTAIYATIPFLVAWIERKG